MLFGGGLMKGAFSWSVPLTVWLSEQLPELPRIIAGSDPPGAADAMVSLVVRPKVGEPQISYWSWVYVGPAMLSPLIQLMSLQSLGRLSRSNAAQSW